VDLISIILLYKLYFYAPAIKWPFELILLCIALKHGNEMVLPWTAGQNQ